MAPQAASAAVRHPMAETGSLISVDAMSCVCGFTGCVFATSTPSALALRIEMVTMPAYPLQQAPAAVAVASSLTSGGSGSVHHLFQRPAMSEAALVTLLRNAQLKASPHITGLDAELVPIPPDSHCSLLTRRSASFTKDSHACGSHACDSAVVTAKASEPDHEQR